MITSIIFALFLFLPFLLYLGNMARVRMESRGIVLQPKGPRKTKLRVVGSSPRTGDCGRHGLHLLLTLTFSRDSCRYCSRDDSPPPPPSNGAPDPSDAVAAAERILDDANR